MPQITLFRLMKTPVDDKGNPLVGPVAALKKTREAEEIYTPDPTSFAGRWRARFPR